MDINVRRHVLTIIVGAFATAFTIYLIFAGSLAEQFDAWLATVVAWASPWAAIISLLVGLVMTWLFLYGLVAPLQGPIARALNGLDPSWLAGMLAEGLLYHTLYRLGMAIPRTSAREEEVGEPTRVDRGTEA